jgi:hypothetical protein
MPSSSRRPAWYQHHCGCHPDDAEAENRETSCPGPHGQQQQQLQLEHDVGDWCACRWRMHRLLKRMP